MLGVRFARTFFRSAASCRFRRRLVSLVTLFRAAFAGLFRCPDLLFVFRVIGLRFCPVRYSHLCVLTSPFGSRSAYFAFCAPKVKLGFGTNLFAASLLLSRARGFCYLKSITYLCLTHASFCVLVEAFTFCTFELSY